MTPIVNLCIEDSLATILPIPMLHILPRGGPASETADTSASSSNVEPAQFPRLVDCRPLGTHELIYQVSASGNHSSGPIFEVSLLHRCRNLTFSGNYCL